MNAIVLSIGDELVLGQTVDTNSAWLSARLVELGIRTLYHQSIADDQAAIAHALQQAAKQAALVLVTGGLGPTEDDLTRQALAQAMGQPLVESAQAWVDIQRFFVSRGRPTPEANRVQALHPAGTTILPNVTGTAPGIAARLDSAAVYLMPGVPREMKEMWRLSVLPAIERSLEASSDSSPRLYILTTKINTFGLGEAQLGERLRILMARDRNPTVGTTVAQGIVSVRIRSEFPSLDTARSALQQTAEQVEQTLGPIVFSRDEVPLQQATLELLRTRALTVATAESCTGGMLGQMLTDIPGSSENYVGGFVSYANEVKVHALGVPAALIESHGAVSDPVARAMAEAALQRTGAQVALSITGIAGPSGGTEDKPVGTVHIALARRLSDQSISCQSRMLRLLGNRSEIRDRACKSALQMLRFHLLGLPFENGFVLAK